MTHYFVLPATLAACATLALSDMAAAQSASIPPSLTTPDRVETRIEIAEGHGVPATRATTAEEFHRQFEAAMSSKGPKLIEAQIVQDIKPMAEAILKARG